MQPKRILGSCIFCLFTTLVVAVHFGCARRESVQNPQQLVVGSWGGAYQEAQRKAYFEPFARETGIKIIETSTPEYGKFYEWQRSGTASADVVDVETYFVLEAGRKGALQPVDYGIVPRKDLLPAALNDFGVASCAYADVIAWNSKLHPNWKDMTWADVWNTQRNSGARGLRDLPASTLEAALLADGVSPESLYPLDVDRAFRSLNRLRGNTRVALWSSGSQPIEWLLSGAVSISTAWNGRVRDAQQSGQPISMTFHNGMVDWLWWVVPKYSKDRELAMKFIAFTLRPDRQAEFARDIPYGPTNLAALKLLDAQTTATLPTAQENLKQEILRDNKWWADHNEEIQPKWREWKLGLGAPQ
jgi:putative spermidine/putrescine transport system substrate-binding protein